MVGDVSERIVAIERAIAMLAARIEEIASLHAQTAQSVQQTIDALPVKTAEKIETMPAVEEKTG